MIVRKIQSPVYHRRRPTPLPGRGNEARQPELFPSQFEEALLEAVDGDVVRKGSIFANSLSSFQRENIIRLSG